MGRRASLSEVSVVPHTLDGSKLGILSLCPVAVNPNGLGARSHLAYSETH